MAFTLVSGVKNGSSAIFGGFAWQVNSQDVVANTSSITVMMYGGRSTSGAGIWNTDVQSSYIEYDGGNRLTIPTKYDFRNATVGVTYYVGVDTGVFASGSVYNFTVTHNPDGTRSVPIKSYFYGNNDPYLIDITTTGTIVLPTIARASQPTLSASSIPFEQAVTIYTNKAAGSSFTHNISYSFGSASGSIGTGVVDSVVWTPARALAAQIPSANSGTGTIICDTYNGATLIGTKTVAFTLTVPATYRAALTPAHTGFTLSTPTLTAYAIQNITTLSLTLSASLSDLVTTYGTTITAYQVSFNAYSSGEVSYTGVAVSKSAGVIPVSGTRYAYYKIKDARGNWSNEVSEQIMGTGSTIYPYGAPANTGFNVSRDTTTPTTAKFEMNFSRSPVGGANKWWYQRQYYDGANWQLIDATNMPNDSVGITTDTLTSVLPHSLPYVEANVYQVRVKLTDLFNTVYYEDTLPTSAVPFALSNKGAGIGKIPTNTTYDLEVGSRGVGSDGVVSGTQLQSSVGIGTPPLTVVSTTKVLKLNVEQVDGYDAGNANGNIPVSNGTLNTNLNANYLEGKPSAFFNHTNWIINGMFDVWQRGTTQTTFIGYGSDDRWKNENGGTTKSHSRQAFAADQTAVPNNPKYYSRTVVTSVAGAGNYATKSQKIEDVTKLAGKTITISFWAKADATKNIGVEVFQYFGATSGFVFIPGTKFVLSTSWQKITLTVAIPSASGKTVDSDSYTTIRFWFDAGTSYATYSGTIGQQSGTFDIANVCVVEGNIASECQQEPYFEVLRKCQRYYEKSFDDDVAPANGPNTTSLVSGNSAHCCYSSNTQYATTVLFKVPKRASPVLTVYGNSNGRGIVNNAWAVNPIEVNNYKGKNGFCVNQQDVNGYAATIFHWAADAEL